MSRLKNLDQALEDVEARFLYNLPESELHQVDRLFFQLEQAWWFYEDFMADVNPVLPHFGHLRTFSEKIFSHCPLLSQSQDKFVELFNNFSAYKSHIPVCGCIMLNPEMTKAVLVCTWKGKSWGFPRGKINENEEPLECAVREAFEECGYDVSQQCKEEDQLVVMEESKATKLFIATNVLECTVFVPQTRKEISEAAFFPLDEFPKSTYAVYPFMPKLKRWISIRMKIQATLLRANGVNKKDKKSKNSILVTPVSSKAVLHTTANTSPKRNAKEWISFDTRNADTFAEEVTNGSKGWGVSDMFKANSRLTGLRYEYDGNPHSFSSYHPQYINYSLKEKNDSLEKVDKAEIATRPHADAELLEKGSPGAYSSCRSSSPMLVSDIPECPRSVGISLINGREVFSIPPSSGLKKKNRKRKGKDEITLYSAIAVKGLEWTGSRLPSPFQFDKQAILSAIDTVLCDTTAAAFDF